MGGTPSEACNAGIPRILQVDGMLGSRSGLAHWGQLTTSSPTVSSMTRCEADFTRGKDDPCAVHAWPILFGSVHNLASGFCLSHNSCSTTALFVSSRVYSDK
jgi:hypothetical protein